MTSIEIGKLPDGARFREAWPESWGGDAKARVGTLVAKSPGCAVVRWDRTASRSFTAHDANGEPVEVAFGGGGRTTTIALGTVVVPVAEEKEAQAKRSTKSNRSAN